MPDKRFREAYDAVTLSEESAARIWAALESELLPREEKRSMKKLKNPVRVFIIAALIAVLMVGSAYAISGIASSTGTHAMRGTPRCGNTIPSISLTQSPARGISPSTSVPC